MTVLERLQAMAAKVPQGRYGYDSPSNWHGIQGRVFNEKYEPVVVIDLSGWGKRRGEAIGQHIADMHNALPTLLALAELARECADSSACAGYPYDDIEKLIAELDEEAQ